MIYKNLNDLKSKKLTLNKFLHQIESDAENDHDEHGVVATTQAFRDEDTGFMIKIEYGYYLGED